MKNQSTQFPDGQRGSRGIARAGIMILIAANACTGGLVTAATTQPAPANENNCKLDCAQQLKQPPYNQSKPVTIGIPTVVNQTIDKLNSEFSNFNISGGSLGLTTAIAQITADQSYTCCDSTSCQTPVSDQSYSGGIGVTASTNFRIPFTAGSLNFNVLGFGLDIGGSVGPDIKLTAGAKANTTLNFSSCGNSATVGLDVPVTLTVTPAAFSVGAYAIVLNKDYGFTAAASASGSTGANLDISVTMNKSGTTYALGAALDGLTATGTIKGGVVVAGQFYGLNNSYTATLIAPVTFGDNGTL